MGIVVKQFNGSSVTPKDDAVMNELIFQSYGIFNGCGISFLGVNQLMVNSGRMIIKGRQVVVTEETIAAQLSSDGTKKGRLYIRMDLSSPEEPAVFLTQVADELPVLTQQEDVNYSDGIFEVELCNYDVSETAVSNIVESCPMITGSMDMLKSIEEVLANTEEGKAVDALVIKELTNSLGGMSFYEDEDGNKYVVGADSVPKKLGSVSADDIIALTGTTGTSFAADIGHYYFVSVGATGITTYSPIFTYSGCEIIKNTNVVRCVNYSNLQGWIQGVILKATSTTVTLYIDASRPGLCPIDLGDNFLN